MVFWAVLDGVVIFFGTQILIFVYPPTEKGTLTELDVSQSSRHDSKISITTNLVFILIAKECLQSNIRSIIGAVLISFGAL